MTVSLFAWVAFVVLCKCDAMPYLSRTTRSRSRGHACTDYISFFFISSKLQVYACLLKIIFAHSTVHCIVGVSVSLRVILRCSVIQ